MTVDLEEEVRDFLFVPEERDFREKELKEEGLKVEGSTVIGISSSSEGGEVGFRRRGRGGGGGGGLSREIYT